ncbi:MAG: hypothetical protein KKE59_08820, partial [Proteobacteria bacterium]|nr:hypothetical protein [Pseudomonadota bacterium]
MACYDLDKFRAYIFEKENLKEPDLDADILEAAKHGDEALLRIGLQWIKDTPFANLQLET